MYLPAAQDPFPYGIRCFLYFLVTFIVIMMSQQQVTGCFDVSMQRGRVSQSPVVFRVYVCQFFVDVRHWRFWQRRICTYYGVSCSITGILSTQWTHPPHPRFHLLPENLSTKCEITWFLKCMQIFLVITFKILFQIVIF